MGILQTPTSEVLRRKKKSNFCEFNSPSGLLLLCWSEPDYSSWGQELVPCAASCNAPLEEPTGMVTHGAVYNKGLSASASSLPKLLKMNFQFLPTDGLMGRAWLVGWGLLDFVF